MGGAWYAATFGSLSAGVWYHLAATYDGETLVAYVDGEESGRNEAPSGATDDSPHTAKIGRHAFRTDYPPFFHGDVDEVRIADVPRSAGWMALQHLSMTDRLVTFGPEERLPGH